MKLYDCAGAPNPRRIRIFLAEKGIDVENVQIDIFKCEHSTLSFTKINPQQKIPCLELDNGMMIAETAAIARYLELVQPEPVLLGRTAEEQALVVMWHRRVEEGILEAAVNFFHHSTEGLGEPDRYRNSGWGDFNKSSITETYRWLDNELETRDFIAGNTFSLADITALCGVDFAKVIGVDIPDDCMNLQSWYKNISARPSASA